jgi:hypothetical protein
VKVWTVAVPDQYGEAEYVTCSVRSAGERSWVLTSILMRMGLPSADRARKNTLGCSLTRVRTSKPRRWPSVVSAEVSGPMSPEEART